MNDDVDVKKLDYIERYFYDHHEDEFFYVILHSLFNCISEKEIQVLYFENARGNPLLKKTIENYVVKRTTNEPKRQFEGIALTLLNIYQEQDFHTQVTIRTFLSQFIRTLSTQVIQRYFDLLILSDRKFDRHRANEVADLIWNDEVEGLLISNFKKYKDEYSLLPLINNLDDETLIQLIENYWTNEFPSQRLKSNIIKKTSKLDIEVFSFLKERDISYYIQALSYKRVKISDSEINKLLKTITGDNKYYLIWTIGMTGEWELITKYLEKLL